MFTTFVVGLRCFTDFDKGLLSSKLHGQFYRPVKSSLREDLFGDWVSSPRYHLETALLILPQLSRRHDTAQDIIYRGLATRAADINRVISFCCRLTFLFALCWLLSGRCLLSYAWVAGWIARHFCTMLPSVWWSYLFPLYHYATVITTPHDRSYFLDACLNHGEQEQSQTRRRIHGGCTKGRNGVVRVGRGETWLLDRLVVAVQPWAL